MDRGPRAKHHAPAFGGSQLYRAEPGLHGQTQHAGGQLTAARRLHVTMSRPHQPFSTGAKGFTLVEVILSMAICAIVLVAVNAVFATAGRLRDRTSAGVDEA